jgi:NosR/NirI family transcriptional regulator, nitrous oxide reductase regulator
MRQLWNHLLRTRYTGLPDRPVHNPDGSTHIPNLFVAGNVAGQPNIKSSMIDGYELGLQLANQYKASPYRLDSAIGIVGCGPAGIGVALALKHLNIDFVIWEEGEAFQNIANYPIGKWIYSLPTEWPLPEGLWFEHSTKEDLLERWKEDLAHLESHIKTHHTVKDIRKYKTVFNVYIETPSGDTKTVKVAQIVLATGTQSKPKKLEVKGEDSPLVQHRLFNAPPFAKKMVLIVGGGSSAIEATLNLLEQGAHCRLIHRGKDFSKAVPELRHRLQKWIDTKMLEVYTESVVEEFQPIGTSKTQLTVTIRNRTSDHRMHLLVEQVFVLIGGQPHNTLLETIELDTEVNRPPIYTVWGPVCAVLIYLFYILKSGTKEVCSTEDCVSAMVIAKRNLFPFTVSDLSHIPQLLQFDLGFRSVDGAFWGTLIYSMLIVGFGLKAMVKYPSKTQRKRYTSLILFQAIFLFGIPEIIAPWIISTGSLLDLFGGARPWKWYAMVIPWPLSLYSVVDAPGYMTHPKAGSIALMWTIIGCTVSFVVIPLYVRFQGQRFCSYMCGCGGLAETVGDAFRSFAPKGHIAKKLEKFGRVIWVLAIGITLLIINDAWNLISLSVLSNTKVFAEKWYLLMVDFWLASVLGIALYPYLGNRVWCRFACPLRAYMETIAKYTTKLSIDSNDSCIGCYECTRQCQMGISVHEFALKQEPLSNQNSACIQCGICIEVCPLDVLHIGQKGTPISFDFAKALTPPKAKWE